MLGILARRPIQQQQEILNILMGEAFRFLLGNRFFLALQV
jgi:hypothetical protein